MTTLLLAEFFPLSCPGIAVQRTASLRSPMTRASIHLAKTLDGGVEPGHDESLFGISH
jgi:hypothetical protein